MGIDGLSVELHRLGIYLQTAILLAADLSDKA
jgi:hypothetical protein